MKTLQNIMQYMYLAFAVFFLYSAYEEYKNDGTKTILFILIAVAALAMFFFKRYMLKKMRK